jgi:hypothetical protein
MRKLLFILLLLPFAVSGQVSYQLNYDSIRVGKTAGTGGTSLYGKTYLKNVSARAVGDSILTVVNGRIFKVPFSGVNLWTRSGTTLSPRTANDSLNIGTGIYKGHGAKSDASDGFLIESSTGVDVGRFGVANTANASLFGGLNVTGVIASNAENGAIAISGGTTNRRYVDISNVGGSGKFGVESSAGGGIITGSTAYDIAMTGSSGISFSGNGGTNLGMRLNSSNALNLSSLSAGGLVKSTTGTLSIATAGTDYLTPTGSGSGLSGVVLTTTNQSVAGVKTFTDSLLSVRNGSNKFKVQGTGASQNATIDIHRGDRIGESTVRYFTKNDASYKWTHGIVGNSNFMIRNATTGYVQDAIVIDTLNNIEVIGNFVSTKATGTNSFNSALSGTSATFSGLVSLGSATATNPFSTRAADGESHWRVLNSDGSTYGDFERSVTGSGALRFTGAYFRVAGTLETQAINAGGAFAGTSATFSSLGTGTVYSNAGVLTNTNPSDSTLKNTIEPLKYGLAEVLKLQPKTFYYNSDTLKSSLKYGFIAQDVKEIMPEIVREINPESKKLGLESDGIYVTLVKAIQELNAKIEEQEARIKILESKP